MQNNFPWLKRNNRPCLSPCYINVTKRNLYEYVTKRNLCIPRTLWWTIHEGYYAVISDFPPFFVFSIIVHKSKGNQGVEIASLAKVFLCTWIDTVTCYSFICSDTSE